MSYKEVELYGRKIRVYDENHIEMEFYGKLGNWKSISIQSSKYKRIHIIIKSKNIAVLLHRLIFYAHNPSWDIYDSSSDNVIDHKNGNPFDNRIENLQCMTQHENLFNNTRAKGYSWNKQNKNWNSYIRFNGTTIYLGTFAEESDARNAYIAAKLKYHIIEERVF